MPKSSESRRIINRLKEKLTLLEIVFVVLFSFLYFLAGTSVSLNRYWQYNSFWYDFGILDETIWKLSRFHLPIISQLNPPTGLLVWGDHFNPSAFLLTPFYWITQKPEIILIAQVLFLVLSALVIYLVARKELNNRFARISIVLSYLGFVGLQNAIFTDIHNIVFASLPFALTIWSIYNNNWKSYWLFLLITLGFQESLAGLGITLGIFLIIKDRKYLSKGLATILLSLVWAVVTTRYLMPAIANHSYSYSPSYPIYWYQWFTDFFMPFNLKLRAIVVTYATFGFTPLFSIAILPIVIEHFLERFVLNSAGTRWDLGFHYNVLLSPIMAMGSIEVLKYLEKVKFPKNIISAWSILTIILVLFIHRFYYHGPLMLATDPIFYDQTRHAEFLKNFESQIPKRGLIMTQNNLASHFTHSNVVLLSKNVLKIQPDVVALDLREGQNPNNFYPGTNDDVEYIIQQLSNANYRRTNITKDEVIFQKKQ